MPRTMFYGHTNVKVAIHPNIGLDAATRQAVVRLLNLLLADESVLAMKTSREDGQAGNAAVTELQSLYDAQRQQIIAISAELTERIQILGGVPLMGSENLIDSARLGGEISPVRDIMNLLADYEAFIRFLRIDAQQCFDLYEDQGTFALLISMLRAHEKMAWILRSKIDVGKF